MKLKKKLCKHPGTKEAREVLKSHGRDLTQCDRCGRSNISLHIHHKDENPFNNRIENLLVLCAHCHRKAHGLIEEGVIDEDEFEVDMYDVDEEAIPFGDDSSLIKVELTPEQEERFTQTFLPEPIMPPVKPKHFLSLYKGHQCRHCKSFRPFKEKCDRYNEKTDGMNKACASFEERCFCMEQICVRV